MGEGEDKKGLKVDWARKGGCNVYEMVMDFLISKKNKKSMFTCKNLVDGVLVVNEVLGMDMRTK